MNKVHKEYKTLYRVRVSNIFKKIDTFVVIKENTKNIVYSTTPNNGKENRLSIDKLEVPTKIRMAYADNENPVDYYTMDKSKIAEAVELCLGVYTQQVQEYIKFIQTSLDETIAGEVIFRAKEEEC